MSKYFNKTLCGALLVFFVILVRLHTFSLLKYDFETKGLDLFTYQMCRFIYLFFFVWIVVGVGAFTLKILRKGIITEYSALEEVVINFFLGASVLTIFLFFAGYLNLYYYEAAVGFAIVCLIATYPLIKDLVARCFRETKNFLYSSEDKTLNFTLLTLIFLTLFLLVVSRVIFPGETSNDSWEHYIPYQAEVIKNHGIWPNDIWYNFFSTKGAGISFLSILFTDILAYQIVTFCFVIAATLILFTWIKKITKSNYWALLAAFLYLAAHLLTNPFQATFHSHHLAAGAFFIAIAWLVTIRPTSASPPFFLWCKILLILNISFIIFIPHFAALLGPFWVLIAITSFIQRDKKLALASFMFACSLTLTLLAVLISNYFVSGMFFEQPMDLMTRFSNRAQLSKWMSPFMPFFLIEGTISANTGFMIPNYLSLDWEKWGYLFRFNFFNSLFLYKLFLTVPFAAVAYFLKVRKEKPISFNQIYPMLAVGIASFIVARIANPPESIFRNFWFLTFFSCFFGIIICWVIFNYLPKRFYKFLLWVFLLAGVWHSAKEANARSIYSTNMTAIARFQNMLSYTFAQTSTLIALYQAGRMWPEGYEIKRTVGIDKDILLFNTWHPYVSGIMVYGSGFLKEPSRSSLYGQWHVASFEPPDVAMAALQKVGINYFAFDLDQYLFSCVAFGPLFTPQNIANYFDIIWEYGNVYALTWKGHGKPITDSFLKKWNAKYESALRGDQIKNLDVRFHNICQNVNIIYQANKNSQGPIVRPVNLPKVLGWQ